MANGRYWSELVYWFLNFYNIKITLCRSMKHHKAIEAQILHGEQKEVLGMGVQVSNLLINQLSQTT